MMIRNMLLIVELADTLPLPNFDCVGQKEYNFIKKLLERYVEKCNSETDECLYVHYLCTSSHKLAIQLTDEPEFEDIDPQAIHTIINGAVDEALYIDDDGKLPTLYARTATNEWIESFGVTGWLTRSKFNEYFKPYAFNIDGPIRYRVSDVFGTPVNMKAPLPFLYGLLAPEDASEFEPRHAVRALNTMRGRWAQRILASMN